MDDFAKRILEKAETRSKALGISKVSTIHPTQSVLSEIDTTDRKNENTMNLKNVPKSNKLERNNSTENKRHFVSVGDKENVDVGIEINITTGSNVEVQVDVAEKTEDGIEIKGNRKMSYKLDGQSSSLLPPIKEVEPMPSQSTNVVLRETSRNRLQRLGNLYSSTDLSSPIHRTEGNFHEGEAEAARSCPKRTKKVNGKLAALADSIKNWEDDTSHPNYKQATFENQSNGGRASQSESSDNNRFGNRTALTSCSSDDNNSSNQVVITENDNQLPWDKKVIDSLQAQGFQRRESKNVKYCYEFDNRNRKEEKASPKKNNIEKYVNEPDPKPQNITSGNVLNRAAIFENISKSSSATANKPFSHKDPAEMTLKERMMLFEKNRGEALVPKSSFAMPIPINNSSKDQPKTGLKSTTSSVTPTCVQQARNIFEGKAQANVNENISGENFIKGRDYEKEKKLINKKFTENRTIDKKDSDQTITNVHYEGKSNEQNQGGSNKRKSPSYKSGNAGNSEGDKSKLLKTNERSGRLYPILPDLELEKKSTEESSEKSKESFSSKYSTNEEEYNSDSSNEDMGITDSSLGRKIQNALRSHEQRVCFKDSDDYEPSRQYEDNSTDISASTETNDVDDFLDEALEEDTEDEDSFQISRRKSHQGTKCSDSFSFKKPQNSPHKSEKAIETDDETITCGEDNVIKLVHTVSFYRRQQSSNTPVTTPSKKIQKTSHIIREVTQEESNEYNAMETDNDDSHLVQEKIQKLLDEVCKQQQIIAQTSHALNWCASTIEFSGSTEAVEGERHLLVATHRRTAALDEVQRLKVEKHLRLPGAPRERGKLTVREITLPLKQDYIRKLAADTISGHHLVCLLKYNENVLATKAIPTLPGLLAVKFPDVLQLNSAYADFRITLEIYGMTAQREILPHEVKYHINVKKSGNKTPKKKGTDSRLIMPIRQSPAGPNVVRTPALVQYAFAIFSLREIQRSTWTLTQVSGVSPLEGTVHMKIDCELTVHLEHKGFLTMFEDISGFGAWHRRWCYLNGHVMNYWKYPDDENKKTPMGSIDLSTCISSKVATAPRDVCARLNTILLECQREAKSSDVESLILIPKGNITIVRHLLSADTKEDREDWTNYFNKALTLLKAWGTGSQK